MADSKLHALPGGLFRSVSAPEAGFAGPGFRRVFLRDMVLPSQIGVHRHEKEGLQRVRINLDLSVREGEAPVNDSLGNVVCYEEIATGVRALVGAGHINLVETLAERLAAFCLKDPRVGAVRVRVEKLDVFPDAASAGVEIVRQRTMRPFYGHHMTEIWRISAIPGGLGMAKLCTGGPVGPVCASGVRPARLLPTRIRLDFNILSIDQ
jgi:dihydroneopterin aldolase